LEVTENNHSEDLGVDRKISEWILGKYTKE